jgi:hypothetical protein
MKKKACAVATLGNNFEMILEIIGATNYAEKFDLYPESFI